MKIICIMGIDGAGKTTLARKTAAALQAEGLPAAYFYGRQYALFSRLVLQAIGRTAGMRTQDEFRDYHAFTAAKREALKHARWRTLYTAAVLLDFYLRSWRRLLPALLTSRILLVDRYFYDTVVGDLGVYLGYAPSQISHMLDWGLRLVPRAAVTVLLDVPVGVAMARKDDVPDPDYLAVRRALYLALRGRPEVRTLDGTEDSAALVAALRAEIARVIPLPEGHPA